MPTPQPVELIKVLADIIEHELDMPKGRVFIYNQKYTLPTDENMFIDVSFVSSRPFGSGTTFESTDAGLVEVQHMHAGETYSINVFSKSDEARIRKHEVIFALNSTYAQQQCEIHNFNIGFIPSSFSDVSSVEAAARLNRYSITFSVIRGYTRRKLVEYFDTFQNPPTTLLTEP